MPLALSRADSRLAAQACRSLASIFKRDAANSGNPTTSEPKLEQAQKLERLAAIFEEHASQRAPGGR